MTHSLAGVLRGVCELLHTTLATVRGPHYSGFRPAAFTTAAHLTRLREHLEAFLNAYNFATRLKTRKGITPYEHICKAWADQPGRFRYDPLLCVSKTSSVLSA